MWDATNQIIIGGTYEDYKNAGCALSLVKGLSGVGVSNAVNESRKFIAAISSLGKRVIVLDTAKEFDMLMSCINSAKTIAQSIMIRHMNAILQLVPIALSI